MLPSWIAIVNHVPPYINMHAMYATYKIIRIRHWPYIFPYRWHTASHEAVRVKVRKFLQAPSESTSFQVEKSLGTMLRPNQFRSHNKLLIFSLMLQLVWVSTTRSPQRWWKCERMKTRPVGTHPPLPGLFCSLVLATKQNLATAMIGWRYDMRFKNIYTNIQTSMNLSWISQYRRIRVRFQIFKNSHVVPDLHRSGIFRDYET